jgi:hypothetical protein
MGTFLLKKRKNLRKFCRDGICFIALEVLFGFDQKVGTAGAG